jgi:hypothetical protein
MVKHWFTTILHADCRRAWPAAGSIAAWTAERGGKQRRSRRSAAVEPLITLTVDERFVGKAPNAMCPHIVALIPAAEGGVHMLML